MNNCVNCQKETRNPKYCSRSCSAQVNNRLKPKRKAKKRYCKKCNVRVSGRRTLCDDCLKGRDMTLEEACYDHLHKSSAFAKIRTRARKLMSSEPQICEACGYDKHVEICHIKPISSFDLKTLVSVVNSRENLMILCPNCHWEFDNN